jgi:hypothetical protein
VARKKLTSDNSVGDASNYQTAIVQPGGNTLVLIFVANTRPGLAGGAATTPTVSGNGLAWQQVQTVATGNGGDRRLTCFRSMAATPTAGQIGIDFGGQTQDFCTWSVFEYDNVDTTGSGGAAAVARSSTAAGNGAALTANLAPSADPMRNFTVGGIMLDLLNDPVRPVNPGAGFTEIDEQTPNQFLGKGTTLQTQDSATALSTIGWTWNGAENAAAIVLEVKAVPSIIIDPGTGPSDPNEALIRRFEPVLFFHPQESTFPVDAKRYVEHSALWASRSAFDDKNNWGVPSDPFPRNPLVPTGKLAAIALEKGDYLGKPEFLVDGIRDERFLELGGWKDKTGAHESGVTATSTNVYADRSEIVSRYQKEPDLTGSRFWYHAELYDTDRLIRLATRVTAPDLSKIVARLSNPMLLCYYLFFPAHEQSVSQISCQNVEAKEAACHAGDWECIAIMLESDGSGNLQTATPKFFGHTGSRPGEVQVNGKWMYRPYQFDDEGLTVMKVEAWRPASGMTANQPEVVGEHPRLYVASGSHSLYTSPGSHKVDPFRDGEASQWCGLYDTPSVVPKGLGQPDSDFLEDVGAFFAKVVAGWSLGPWGLIAGLVAAGIEGVLPLPHGFTGKATGNWDSPEPDEAPAAGDGKTVRPAGLTIPDGGSDVQDWTAQQGLELNGRRYDFMVNRAKQVWWPSDDGAGGFRGRWGQHVTSDFLPRRSGPKFPDYVKMFLLALADGDARTGADGRKLLEL